ncbi:hypothetical protein HPB49_002856 [Dermacentor silvarum]|uniref:Uncharacterized protein n=1 Tax=Dermacentor silvarum TaxID=543639 RepID=A0ACB8CJ96_DERSI|nr:hypothetical protein HPB49_002856 [Dermacentor silvarum]
MPDLMTRMEVSVDGELVSRKEFEESAGWRTVGSRKLSREKPLDQGAEPKRGNSSKKQREERLRQIARSSRMPQLPRGDYKIIIRPRGGLRVADHGAARLATSIYHAAEIPREAQDEDTICTNCQQNIIVVSTPIEAHADKYQKISRIKIGNQAFETSAYEAAPDCTSKGVIRGIPLEDTARDITANVITPRNPTAIAAKRLSNTMTVIVLFTGLRVPTYVRYGGALLPCSLYRKQIDTCYQCGRLGHRADVCPNPNDRLCRGCGAANPAQDHQCKPKCQLCGGNHPTADKACRARYKTPYLVKRRQWERQQEEDYPTKPTLVNTNLEQRDPSPSQKPGGRGRSRSRNRSGGRRPSRSRTRSPSRSRTRSRTPVPAGPFKVSWADAVKGARSGSEEAASQGKWNKLEAEIVQLKQMLAHCNQKITALGEENRTLKEELCRYKQTEQVTPVASPPLAVTPTDQMEEGTTPPPPKRKAETQANEDKPKRAPTETNVVTEFQQSIKELNEWMSNSSRLISALTERVDSIAKITQQQNEQLQQRLLAVEALITPSPPSSLEPMASVQQPTSSPFSLIQPATFVPPAPNHS